MSEIEEVASDMLRRGSIEVQALGDLRVGSRVRHVSEQWPRAYQLGTGSIRRIFHKPNSAWEQKYGRPDIELIVTGDDGRHRYLADYHVDLVTP